MNSPCGPSPTPSDIGSRHEKPSLTTGIGSGLADGLGLMAGLGVGELTASGDAETAGDATCALSVAGVPQAQMNAINAKPANFMLFERTPQWRRYCVS